MSRVGRLPIKVPDEMSVTIIGNDMVFEIGKIRRSHSIKQGIVANYNNGEIFLSNPPSLAIDSSRFGMERSNIKNIVFGMCSPFRIVLEVNGVGYKFTIDKDLILFSLGYSHEILYHLPRGISANFEKPNLIVISGVDKIIVGQVAAEIISFRRTEPYKGKGIKIFGKSIVRKEGKKK